MIYLLILNDVEYMYIYNIREYDYRVMEEGGGW